MTLEIKEILRLARQKFKTDAELCKVAKLNKSTLWRIEQGRTTRSQDATIGKLIKAMNRPDEPAR